MQNIHPHEEQDSIGGNLSDLFDTASRQKTCMYSCGHCIYVTNRADNFKRHVRQHTGQLFHCDICDRKYNSKYRLQVHCKEKHVEKYI